jgi:hypothetical protein
LLPTLRPGDIVIMDNLGSHKSKIVRQLIRSVGAKLLFLPKYSPNLNPDRAAFAKLKHLLRKAAARTLETVCTAIAELLGVLADAINLGLIATDSRPGGNVTGVSFRTEGLTSKQVELGPRIVRRRAATDHQ